MRFSPGICLSTLLLGASLLANAADAPPAYTNQCTGCHGVDGHGKTTNQKLDVPDLHSKKVQDLSDDDLYETIARGAKHRAYPHAYLYRGMKEKDIREIVKFIRTMAPSAK